LADLRGHGGKEDDLRQSRRRGAASALYDPVWTGAVLGSHNFALALVGFVLLTVWKAPPWLVVLLLAAGGMGLALP
jgi:hypothetical protein